MVVRVTVIGELGLEIDGQRVPPPRGRPACALLAWLALHPGSHPRELVAARLWPDVLDSSARTSLRSALARVTKALGIDAVEALVTTRDTVGLAAAPAVTVDAAEFADLLRNGELEAAWRLGERELLRGLGDEWVYAERNVHAERVAEVLELLAVREEASHDPAAALAWTRLMADREPLSEEVARRLMRRMAAAGDRGAAMAAFERFRERLASELAVGVSAETRALADKLRAEPEEPSLRGPVRPLPLPPLVSARRELAFVGRENELRMLRAAWERALAGDQSVVALAGHPGIGKTSLAAEFARERHSQGAHVLFGRCDEDALIPYQPFAETVGQLVAGLPPEQLASWAALGGGELARIVPSLPGRVPGLPPPLSGDPDGARHRMLGALAAVFDNAASRAPTLLVIDDLHLADRPSLLVLGHLARTPRDSPLLVLVTFRRAELATRLSVAEALEDLRRDRLLERITIGGLSESVLTTLLSNALGGPPTTDLVRALARHTDGNPFFVEEIVRDWRGTLPAGDESAVAEALRQHGLPPGVRDIIGRRLARLAPDSLNVLRLAAVLGSEFDLPALGALAELDEERLLDTLAEPLRARIVAGAPGHPGGLAFHHTLVRDVLYEGIPQAERALLHRRAGRALDRFSPEGPERPVAELAHHFGLAPRADAGRAAGYAERAGEQALASLAYEDAVAHFSRALALRPDAELAARAELLLRLGEANERAGDLTAAREACAAAAEVGRRLDDPVLFARAALGLAGRRIARMGSGEERESALLEQALAGLGEQEPAMRVAVLARLAQAHYTDAHQELERLAALSLAEARTVGDDTSVMAALEATLFASWIPGGARERMALADELIELADRAGELQQLAEALNWRLVAALELGDLGGADRDIARYADLAAKLQAPQLLNYAGVHRAMRALLDGRFDHVEPLAAAALADSRGGDDAAQLFGIQLFLLRDEQARLGELVEPLAAYAATSRQAPTWRLALAWAYAESGHADEARGELEALAADDFGSLVEDVTWPSAMSLAARLCAELRDATRGELVYRLLSPFSGMHVISAFAAYSGPVDHHIGLAATAAGRPEDAIQRFEAALAAELTLGAGPWTAHTRAALAAALLERADPGDAARAAELLALARTTAERLGMTRLLQRLDR